jgi:hypothetical protein
LNRYMTTYHQHRRLLRQFSEFADALADESELFQSAAHSDRRSRKYAKARDHSCEWLQHAARATIMATLALRDARDSTGKSSRRNSNS